MRALRFHLSITALMYASGLNSPAESAVTIKPSRRCGVGFGPGVTPNLVFDAFRRLLLIRCRFIRELRGGILAVDPWGGSGGTLGESARPGQGGVES